MSDPALPSNWLDLPHAEAGLPTPEPIPPDIQALLERIADAIAAVRGPELRSLARYLAVDPGKSRLDKVTQRLPERSLIPLLRRMTDSGRAPSSAALSEPTLEALSRKALLARVLDDGRIIALERACAAVSRATQRGGQIA